jgi:hypothetical protein
MLLLTTFAGRWGLSTLTHHWYRGNLNPQFNRSSGWKRPGSVLGFGGTM